MPTYTWQDFKPIEACWYNSASVIKWMDVHEISTNISLYSYTRSHACTQYICAIYLNQSVDMATNLTGDWEFDSLQGWKVSIFYCSFQLLRLYSVGSRWVTYGYGAMVEGYWEGKAEVLRKTCPIACSLEHTWRLKRCRWRWWWRWWEFKLIKLWISATAWKTKICFGFLSGLRNVDLLFNLSTPNDLQRRRAVTPSKIKIPVKNLGRQRCAEVFNSGVKVLTVWARIASYDTLQLTRIFVLLSSVEIMSGSFCGQFEPLGASVRCI
jgi:hypothetical protein